MAGQRNWPEVWNDGARSTVEPFLANFFSIELSATWNYLVKHRELRAVPEHKYNPIEDARAHARRHSMRQQCRTCAVWEMLSMLWSVTAQLHEGRGRVVIWQDTQRLLRRLTARFAALEHDPLRAVWHAQLRDTMQALERLVSLTHASFGEDARTILKRRGRDRFVRRICRLLHTAGFSYAEIARLIGDHAAGARDRVRKRCTSG